MARIERGDRNSLVFVIQVILEGWGITHYKRMLDGSTCSRFQDVLQAILNDEARHHGSGIVLCRTRKMSTKSRKYTTDSMKGFLDMVRLGPQTVLGKLDQILGLTRQQKIKVYHELNGHDDTHNKLKILKDLMGQDGYEEIQSDLEEKGYYCPYAPEDIL